MHLLQRLLTALLLLIVVPSFPGSARGQSTSSRQAQATPVFDVAAIHLHESQPHEHNSIWSSPFDGRFKAENISVMMLLHWADEMPETRILGAPAWTRTIHFNIDATADPSVDQQLKVLTSDAGRKQKEKMVRALLSDRFKLAAHTETRELPIYALVVAKGGPKLGQTQQNGSSVNASTGRMEVQGSNSMAILAEELSKVVGRDVVDKTGIAGRYDLKLNWSPDEGAPGANVSGSNAAGAAAADSGPSIFTALEEQLGLKLKPQKGPVQVLVVDHVEMPSAN